MNPFGMVLTNPAVWAGVLAVGIPLAIHLLTRKTTRTLKFPTIRFLRKVQASQSAVYRIRHIIMLLLRTAFVALLLLAFLKPVFQARTLADKEHPDARHAAIIILDASLSMGYTGSGFSPFSQAKLAAEKILENLHPDDRANLVLAATSATSSFDEPSANRFHLKNDIQKSVPTSERADLDAAIAEAVAQLKKTTGLKKEIHFVSDFQRSNWAAVDFAKIPKDVKTVFISVADQAAANAAIIEALLQPPSPAIGEPVEVVCKVANYGLQPRHVPVELKIGDDQLFQHELDVPAGTTSTTSFRLRPNRSEIFEGTLTIPEDGLAADNQRFFALKVSDQMQVVLLSDENPKDPQAAHRFLMSAINPYTERARGAVLPTMVSPQQFDKFAAARTQVLVVSGCREISEPTAQSLLQFLKDGGGILWFLGGSSDRANLLLLEKVSGGDATLPFKPGDLVERSGGGSTGHGALTQANFDHAILRPFRESQDLGEIRFHRYFATQREQGQGQVLLRYEDRHVALARRAVGAGALLICNFSPDIRSSDLAKRTLFVPLIHEMLRDLKPQGGGARLFTVGQPASTTVKLAADGEEIRFTNPSGEKISALFELGKEEAAVIFAQTKGTGFYRVHAGAKRLGTVAVNVDERESNLDSLSLEQIEGLSRISQGQFFAAGGADVEVLRNLREGKPLWHYFLLAASCLLGLEQALSMVWRW